ncbi:galactose mutarotase [Ameyamaea chiangmaiensis NBRC 103196]|uniref:Aldose 1-epimerase family protein n=1 Tax=Ameyamaea chiangmaiensis TaxID=442969 RepID=A0A850PH98_9PROT|nr:aldose 1-epimerase family protein [Ameyamaea chiangmaiensis]MBS4075881.1 aldose 1-epimerase family protein [Ameyamaea chiangmaiensis]NVN41232.1 aldose 1-epimerase family protein [Ameyamaea chiangmaiensis]GBQ64084.1 galactose mutarotase [Ameyamaea chiangmaiensis NBRC 103196]
MTSHQDHQFGDDILQATVAGHGAELVSLRADGREILWSGGPPWERHSPVLFPIVGKLARDTARIDGQEYLIGQHGFARDRDFVWLTRDETGCELELTDDDATRAMYPRAFRLVIGYRIVSGVLTVRYRVTNPSPSQGLPFSLGTHPAFVWPLSPDTPREAHVITFANPEEASIRRLENGLIQKTPVPSPVVGQRLSLSDDLFVHDALIFDPVHSRTLAYRGGPAVLTMTWDHFAQLGIWTKPGAGFLCLEPWSGHSSPADFDGPFEDKPGVIHLDAGATWQAQWSVRFTTAP